MTTKQKYQPNKINGGSQYGRCAFGGFRSTVAIKTGFASTVGGKSCFCPSGGRAFSPVERFSRFWLSPNQQGVTRLC